MSEELFRREALEHLSASEQLDMPIEITTPKAWVATLALMLFLLVVAAWSVLGRLPITVQGPGILLDAPLKPIPSMASGQVLDVLIKPGDVVREGQIVASLQSVTEFPQTARIDIEAPFSGTVAHVEVRRGQIVQVGDSLAAISATSSDLKAILYLPVDQGKRVRPGMMTRISPSTADEAEYGYVIGRVLTVANFPADHGDMMAELGNEDLVKFFLGDGSIYQTAPIKVMVGLERDLSTPSGFIWSSGKGPNFGLGAGTVCRANVVVDSNRPIDLVIPYLDKVFGANPW